MTQDELKQAVARAAVDYITPKLFNDSIVGVGTGSTANFFIDYCAPVLHRIIHINYEVSNIFKCKMCISQLRVLILRVTPYVEGFPKCTAPKS